MPRTYIQNNHVAELPDDYSETSLQSKFAVLKANLQEKMTEYENARMELEQVYKEDKAQPENDRIYDAKDILKEYSDLYRRYGMAKIKYERNENHIAMLNKYGTSFVQLYKIKEDDEKFGENTNLSFVEVDITQNGDILTQDQYFGMQSSRNKKVQQIALQVKLDDVTFNLGMMEYHKPGTTQQTKMQLSFDDKTLQNLDEEKLKKIFDFCESHGLSTLDMEIRRFDGSLAEDEIQHRINQMLEKIKSDQEAEIALANKRDYEFSAIRQAEIESELQKAKEEGKSFDEKQELEEVSYDEEPRADEIFTSVEENSEENSSHDSENQSRNTIQNVSSAGAPAVPKPQKPKKSNQQIAEEKLEELFETGMSKRRGLSYFKTHTGLFRSGWTEYVLYGNENPDNRKNDGIKDEKTGDVKYTYELKVFVKQDKNGKIHLAYRMPNHRKIDESVVGDLLGVLKDMGYTHINFPQGISNVEKGIWRKAMGEKGLVPVGMGLDRSKAEGMLKAGKEKLSAEKYSEYRYQLGTQMNNNNIAAGKVPDTSEQAYIDGLINSKYYSAFTDGYALVLKSKVKTILQTKNQQTGAINRIAAYRTLGTLFDIYRDCAPQSSARGVAGGKLLAQCEKLSDEEKQIIKAEGLNVRVDKLTTSQIGRLYDILLKRQQKETQKELYEQLIEVRYGPDVGAKRADKIIINDMYGNARNAIDMINDGLAVLGLEEVAPIKSFNCPLEHGHFINTYLPEYKRTHGLAEEAVSRAEYSNEDNSSNIQYSHPRSEINANVVKGATKQRNNSYN